jgi:hypothetical protein
METQEKKSVRYNIDDQFFLRVYNEVCREGGGLAEVTRRLREKAPNLPDTWASQRATILRDLFKKQSGGKRTLPKLNRGRKTRSIATLIEAFGEDVE